MEDIVRLKSIACPFCYPKTFLSTASPKHKKTRKCPYCERVFFYWKRRYYISLDDLKYVSIEFKVRFHI